MFTRKKMVPKFLINAFLGHKVDKCLSNAQKHLFISRRERHPLLLTIPKVRALRKRKGGKSLPYISTRGIKPLTFDLCPYMCQQALWWSLIYNRKIYKILRNDLNKKWTKLKIGNFKTLWRTQKKNWSKGKACFYLIWKKKSTS